MLQYSKDKSAQYEVTFTLHVLIIFPSTTFRPPLLFWVVSSVCFLSPPLASSV